MQIYLLPVIWIYLAYSGCISYTALQTARTVNPGRSSSLMGVSMYESPSLNRELDPGTQLDRSRIRDYTIVLGHRRGITKNSDIGFQVSFIGTAKFDGKYMFFQTGGFAAAAGFALGYSNITTGEREFKSRVQIVDYILPLYLSYSTAALSLYLVPHHTIRDVSGDVAGGMAIFGYTIGLMGGEYFKMALELTQLQTGISNIALGYYFN